MWPKTVLAISSHADDLELGAGGTVHKWTKEGAEVYHVILSTLKQKEVRKPEIYAANEILGIPKGRVLVYDLAHRRFNENRQDVLQYLCDAMDTNPDVILTHCSYDTHQDHEVVYKESLRAFRNKTILGYEDPWNMYESNLRLTVTLDSQDMAAKCKAVATYKTQAYRPFVNETFICGMASMRGMMVKQDLAENFEVIRWVI